MAIRLGDIRFLNSWPVTYALRKGIIPSDVQMVSGTPAELNRKLLTGELDASAVSSILYLRHLEEFVPIPKFCIRSESGVHSVLVVSRQPLEKLVGKKIGVSNEGATTPVLLKLLLHQRKLKISLEVTSLRYPKILEEYPAALLIGDEALEASQSAEAPGAASTSRSRSAEELFTWDLGEAWAGCMKSPFVFSLWVVRRSLVEEKPELLSRLSDLLTASYEWGRSHQEELIAQMRKTFPFEATFLKKYLSALSYTQDAKAWAALKRFAQEAEKIGELPKGTAGRVSGASLRPRAPAKREAILPLKRDCFVLLPATALPRGRSPRNDVRIR